MGPANTAAHLDIECERKAWATLVARAAIAGYALWRSDAADGPQRLFLGRWGMVRCIADAAELDRLLEQVGA